MQTAILTIGDELLDGSVTDTNAAWLGEFLADHGLRCGEIRTIADDLTAIETTLRQLAEGHELWFAEVSGPPMTTARWTQWRALPRPAGLRC